MVSIKQLALDLASRSDTLVWTETVLFAVINVAAFFGNLFVCYAVYRNQRLRTISNMFVVALAASDILVSICCVPFSVPTLYRGQWVSGETLCRLHGFGVLTFGLASLQSMQVIAVSRYFCVVNPEKYIALFKKQRTLIYITFVWCVAVIGPVPLFLFKHGGYEFQPGKTMCLYAFHTKIAYTVFIEGVYILAPLTIITICYARVFYTVSRPNRVFSHENYPQMLRANMAEAKVTKTLAAVMVGFACCWLPVSIIDYKDAVPGEPTLPRQAYLTYGFLVYLSGTINPFICGVTNKQFRREYKAILSGMFCLKSCLCMRVLEVDLCSESRRNQEQQSTNQSPLRDSVNPNIY